MRRLVMRALFRSVVCRRAPDFVIGGDASPYLERWHLIPRNRLLNVYLHQFLRSDDDRAPHDHPWANLSWLLSGRYDEHTPRGVRTRRQGALVVRRASSLHRIELTHGPVWTLFVTGPKVREWGFACPSSSNAGGWRHWRDFTSADDGGATVGKGCD